MPSAPLSRRACALIFLPDILPINSTCRVIEGVCQFLVMVEILNSEGNDCSQREDKTRYLLVNGPAVRKAPSNNAMDELFKNPSPQDSSGMLWPVPWHRRPCFEYGLRGLICL